MDDLTDGGRIAFQLVNNSRSVDNQNCDAKIAWDRLVVKYEPSTAPRYMTLERDLVNSKLAFNKNPDGWMTYVGQLVCEVNKCTVTCYRQICKDRYRYYPTHSLSFTLVI